MLLICSKCNKEFEYCRHRKNCFECVPGKDGKNLTSEERISKRKRDQVEAVTKRRKEIKNMSVEYKGGKCQICGYDKCTSALEFHHLNPSEKDFGIGYKGYTRSWKKVKEELDKCVMVCANCHREIHDGFVDGYIIS